eukprot:NP_494981.1 Uncharacterized protein CELE_EGAP2.2 [Caenorhabditis elegans]
MCSTFMHKFYNSFYFGVMLTTRKEEQMLSKIVWSLLKPQLSSRSYLYNKFVVPPLQIIYVQ